MKLFNALCKHCCKIYDQPDMLYKQIPNEIYKHIYLARDIKLNGDCCIKNLPDININLVIIRSNDNIESFNDTILLEGQIYLISVIPMNFSNYHLSNLSINTLRNIYQYWIETIRLKYPALEGSTLDKLFKVAPIILTFKTILPAYRLDDFNLERFIMKNDKEIMKTEVLTDCFTLTVEELLDDAGILSIIE